MSESSSPSATDDSVHVFPDLEALSRAAAQHVAAHIETVLARRERYALALSGGSTPRRLYELLATVYSDTLSWNRVDIFWGDERFVPHDNEASNTRLAREHLIEAVDVPSDNVHPVPILDTPEASAAAYEDVLRRHFDGRTRMFNLALMGLGADGHTASLFPGDLEEDPGDDSAPWVRAVEAPPSYDVRSRITCTFPVFNTSEQALFLVAGEAKREALANVLDSRDPSLPASHIAPRERLTWFVDRAARPTP